VGVAGTGGRRGTCDFAWGNDGMETALQLDEEIRIELSLLGAEVVAGGSVFLGSGLVSVILMPMKR